MDFREFILDIDAFNIWMLNILFNADNVQQDYLHFLIVFKVWYL